MNNTIRLKVDDVLPQLNEVAKVVNPKAVLPILQDLMVEVYKSDEGGKLILTASDIDTWVSVKATLIDVGFDMRICVNAQRIAQVFNGLKGQEVDIEVDANAKSLKINYRNGKYEMPYEDANEFPSAEEASEELSSISVSTEKLGKSISSTEFAAAQDPLRPIMNGIHFDCKRDALYTAASDGLKLSRHKDLSVRVADNEEELSFTYPKAPAQTLSRLLALADEDVTIKFNERIAVVVCSHFKVVTRLVDGKYPDYNRVIPTDNHNKVIVNRCALIDALNRNIIFSDTHSTLIKIELGNGGLVVLGENIDYSCSGREEVQCEYNGDAFKIGFNGGTLVSLLRSLKGDEVELALKDESHACVLRSHPYSEEDEEQDLLLIMPLRLNT